jgi:hypothetical protein
MLVAGLSPSKAVEGYVLPTTLPDGVYTTTRQPVTGVTASPAANSSNKKKQGWCSCHPSGDWRCGCCMVIVFDRVFLEKCCF